MQELNDYLSSLHPGPIADTTQIEALLAIDWANFDGSQVTSMEGYKLRDRMENVVWMPPIISFQIERHGPTVMGSSRAKVQSWEINVEERSAKLIKEGHRQLDPVAPRLDTRAIADELTQLIINHKEDERLKWDNKTKTVRIIVGKVIPEESTKKQTLAYRRKKLRENLHQLLNMECWKEVGRNKYSPPEGSEVSK